MGAFKVTITAQDENSTDSESIGLMIQHALSTARNQWIIDSGATCHMYNKKARFSSCQPLQTPTNVVLGDGRNLQAVGYGDIVLTMNLPHGKMENCTLHNVFLVPELAYNLLSAISASKKGKVTTFWETRCEVRDSNSKIIAMGHREGSLYYLDHTDCTHQACVSSSHNRSKETMWHRRFGHLGTQGMQELAKSKMAKGLDFDCKQDFSFCEPCVQGKSHRLPFQQSSIKRTDHPLDLIHSDVCVEELEHDL